MFASLKRAFQMDREPAEEQVQSRKTIVAILHQLKLERELLCISIPGCAGNANTAILGMREANDSFILDELNTPKAHKNFLKKRKAIIKCRLQGSEIRFACRLRKARSKDGIAFYEVAIPGSVMRLQRRQNFRLRLGSGVFVPVSIPDFEGQIISGEAFDLSATGIGALFRTRTVPGRGTILSSLSVSLPGTSPLEASAEVRFSHLDSVHNMVRVGARFTGLDRKKERQLEQFVAEQQRKRRRYGPG